MCEPTTIMMALQVASAVGTVASQKQAADAQADANQRQYQNTIRAFNANINQTNLEMTQEREASMQKLAENNLKAQAARATARTASGEAGVSGLSVDALMGDIYGKQGRYNDSVATNYDRAMGAIQNQRENVYANAASTINGLKTPAMPDYFGQALKIGQAVQSYRTS